MKTETRQLPCALSASDVQDKITELQLNTANTARIDEMEANYRAEIKLARAHNTERIKTLTREIAKGIGLKSVTCEVRPKADKAAWEVVRLDTGKVVEVVPMTAAEASEFAPTLSLNAAPVDDGQNHADVLEALG